MVPVKKLIVAANSHGLESDAVPMWTVSTVSVLGWSRAAVLPNPANFAGELHQQSSATPCMSCMALQDMLTTGWLPQQGPYVRLVWR